MDKVKFVNDSVDNPYDIVIFSNSELIQLSDNYVLESLQLAIVSNYPHTLLGE